MWFAQNKSGFLNNFFDRVPRGDLASVETTGGTLKFWVDLPCGLVISGHETFMGTLNPFVIFA
jgi:serine/threonine protein kinase HipA of HipAB toxin-antitoxin module